MESPSDFSDLIKSNYGLMVQASQIKHFPRPFTRSWSIILKAAFLLVKVWGANLTSAEAPLSILPRIVYLFALRPAVQCVALVLVALRPAVIRVAMVLITLRPAGGGVAVYVLPSREAGGGVVVFLLVWCSWLVFSHVSFITSTVLGLLLGSSLINFFISDWHASEM